MILLLRTVYSPQVQTAFSGSLSVFYRAQDKSRSLSCKKRSFGMTSLGSKCESPRRDVAARGGVRRTNRQNAATGRDTSRKVGKIWPRSCEPLPCPGRSQTAIAGTDCSTAVAGSPLLQSNRAEWSSTSVLPFLNEQLSAERGGQMFMHYDPSFPLFFPDSRVPHRGIDRLTVLHFRGEVHRHRGPGDVPVPSHL